MEESTRSPMLDYAVPERRGAVWPYALLMVLGVVGVWLVPSVGCACWRGEYKIDLALLASGGVFVRAVVALVLRERGWWWAPYVVFWFLAFWAGPGVIDAVL